MTTKPMPPLGTSSVAAKAIKTGMSAEASDVAEAKPKWMRILNSDTSAIVARIGSESSPINPKVFSDSHVAAPVSSRNEPREIPMAKTMRVPQLTDFCASGQVNTPIFGNSIRATATAVMTAELIGCSSPSVAQKKSRRRENPMSLFSSSEVGPRSSSCLAMSSFHPSMRSVSGLMTARMMKYSAMDIRMDQGAAQMNHWPQETDCPI